MATSWGLTSSTETLSDATAMLVTGGGSETLQPLVETMAGAEDYCIVHVCGLRFN